MTTPPENARNQRPSENPMNSRWHRLRKLVSPWRNRLRESVLLPWGGAERLGAKLAGRFRVRRLTLPFPALPAGLEGLTITHLSDLHAGKNADPRQHLPPVIDAVRELDSDLIAVTGDWIDQQNVWLEALMPFVRELKAPLGVWGVLGNHDLRDSRYPLVKELRSHLGPRLLVNDAAVINIDGARFGLLGLDFSHGNVRWRRHLHRTREKLAALARPDFLLALVHDPDLWDPLRERAQADLTLAGHTHGGQISLAPEPYESVGPASLKFTYKRGLYEQDGRFLYVTNGLAQTIPLRLRCPTEVVQMTLRRDSRQD